MCYLETDYTTLIVLVATCKNEKVINKYEYMYIDSKFIFYISFSDHPEALINAVFQTMVHPLAEEEDKTM